MVGPKLSAPQYSLHQGGAAGHHTWNDPKHRRWLSAFAKGVLPACCARCQNTPLQHCAPTGRQHHITLGLRLVPGHVHAPLLRHTHTTHNTDAIHHFTPSCVSREWDGGVTYHPSPAGCPTYLLLCVVFRLPMCGHFFFCAWRGSVPPFLLAVWLANSPFVCCVAPK